MLQSIHASRPVNQIRPSALTAAPRELPALNPYAPDSFSLQSLRSRQEAEALATLTHLQDKVGRLHKPAVFSSPRISVQEAMERLKKGETVFLTNHANRDVKDYFKNFKELFQADDLIGRRGDHGVAKPELRLPLLFTDGHKLEPYQADQYQTYHDAYTAYQDLARDWRILIDGKEVKPARLAAHVIEKGWTQGKDPSLAILAQFRKLAAEGWKVNGATVSRDVAYLAFLTGSTTLTYEAAALQSPKDLALLLNLAAGEDNGAVDKDLRGRLLNLNLGHFNAAGLKNFYAIYKHLEAGHTLSYQGNPLGSLNDVILYDALEGSKQATPLLDNAMHAALLYLQDGGLSTSPYKAFKKLNASETVSYTFTGGPTGEPITLQAASLSDLGKLQQQVVTQREKDGLRPDFREAKDILVNRLPQFGPALAANLATMKQKAEAASQDLPLQEGRLTQARQDYARIKPQLDQSLSEYQAAKAQAQQAEKTYQGRQREYQWARDRYLRVQHDYDWEQRRYEDATRQSVGYHHMAAREEQLVTSDPQNAAAHRQKAAEYRRLGDHYRFEADRHYREMQRLSWDLRYARDDMDRTERSMEQARRDFRQAEQAMLGKQAAWQQQDHDLKEAGGRIQQAESQIACHQQTLGDTQRIQQLTTESQGNLTTLSQLVGQMQGYEDYAQVRSTLHQAMDSLNAALADKTYTNCLGDQLHSQLQSLVTLLRNMDKPAT